MTHSGTGSPASPHRKLAASIDLGTNTVLLLVVGEDAGGRLEVVEELCRTPRLGSGLARRDTLDPEACARAEAVLLEYRARLDALGVPARALRAVGTACLRRAKDGAEFARRMRVATGIPLEVLSEEDEARLSALAVAAEGVGPETVVVDVGGGSTEVACEARGVRLSRPIGAVVLAETYLGAAPAEPGGFEALLAHARREAAAYPAGLAAGGEVVAVGGTGVNLACLQADLTAFDPRAVEGAVLPAGAALERALQLDAMPLEARRRLPIEPERAEVLPAGLACLAATLERVSASRVRVTGRGLRYGVVREVWKNLPSSRE